MSRGTTRPDDAAAGLRRVAELAALPDRSGELVDRALQALADAIPYRTASFLELHGEDLVVRQSRGRAPAKELRGRTARLQSHPTLRRAVEERLAARLTHDDLDADEAPPFGDVIGAVAPGCWLVVPVHRGTGMAGLLLIDAARPEGYGEEVLPVARAFASVIGLGLAAAEQARTLERLRESLQEQNRLLVEEIEAESAAVRALEASRNRVMRQIVQMAKQVAVTDAPVLLTGETGTGKEVLARAIHAWSRRAEGQFIQVNCAALPGGLVESELFGHRKGAFSGADRARPGRFRLADGGTLLLDEIGDLPADVQVKLLRVLQEGTFEPVGGDRSVEVDVRVIAATNANLAVAIDEGHFREDLYYRLHVFPIHLPPLRERLDDLPVLVERILERLRRRTGRGPWTVGADELARMSAYDWPGNVRELVNVIERARVFRPAGGELSIDLSGPGKTARRERRPERWPTLKEHEKEYLERVLRRTGGKIYGEDGAAALLRMPPTTLQSRLARLGIRRRRRRRASGS
ncbi:MAG: sigma 54-interacting transcriptional regulator [Acidobacteriota bacterium]|jgi:transcriptional regulator with GAF, ATPase, and Fis domain